MRTSRTSPPSLRGLLKARDRVHDEHEEPLTLDDLARTAGLSRFHFLRAFNAAFGTTPHDYLARVRLEQAKRHLARGASVTEACMASGFSSLGSFSTRFSRDIGLSPRAWQRRARTLIAVPTRWPTLYIPSCFLWFYGDGNFEEAPSPAIA